MWLKKLKHKKMQFSLVGIILFVSALIFSASLCFTLEAGRLGEEYYNRDESMPNLFYTSADKEVPEAIKKALPDAYLGAAEGVWLTEPVVYQEEKITGMLMVFSLEDYKDVLWEIAPKEGDTASKGPKQGEVWITKVWADLKGIKPGDTITVQGNRLKVGALINSYVNPSTGIMLHLFFVSPSDMESFSQLPSAFIVPLCVTGDLDDAKTLITPLTEGYSQVISIDKNGLIASLSTASMILGGVGMISAMLIFIVAVFVIRFLLRANLIKEYRSIGIYKSQGFSNSSIRGFYLKCYAFVGGISIILGLLASLPAINALIGLTTRYMTNYSGDSSYASGLIISFILLFLILVINVYAATKSINKITPVAALRIGVTSSKEKFKRSIIKNAYSPLSMAVNDIGKYKGYSLMIVSIICVSLYLAIFTLSMNITINECNENVDVWFSIPKADFYVTGRIEDSLIEDIKSDSAVKKVIVSEEWFSTSVKFDEMYHYNNAVSAWCFSDFSHVPYAQGRAPSAKNEIAVGNMLLNVLGLNVGDYVSLTLGNTKDTFLITGAFNAMISNGIIIHLPAESLPLYGVDFVPAVLSVMLKDGESSGNLINYINRNNRSVKAASDLDMVIDAAKGIQDMVSPIMVVMIIMFIMFSVLCIANLIIQNHADNRRQYGIMKALGFSAGHIAARSAWRIFILFFAAVILSVILHLTCSKGLFNGIMSLDGLVLAIHQVLLLLLCLFLLIMALTLIFCLPIRKITPQELIEE